MAILSVREIQARDIPAITAYWLESDPAHLTGMGVDLAKVPTAAFFKTMLSEQLTQDYPEKQSYCLIWEADGEPVGHSNVNRIVFGQEAYMHLHLWTAGRRQQGIGSALVRMTLPYFFRNLQLQQLYCEPYALNPAPNRTLAKVGFEFVREHITVPGSLNFEQPARLWVLTAERFKEIV